MNLLPKKANAFWSRLRTGTVASPTPLTPSVSALFHIANQPYIFQRNLATATGTNHKMEYHNTVVQTISASVRDFYERKEKFRIFHGSTNSTRPFNHDRIVDTSALNRVLKIDKDRQTALVEPNVPMDRLVEATLPHGLIPPVVMEFPGITAGGGYAGTSGESSSFRHGFFDRTLNYVEMVLANGEVVTCSDTDKPDLFHGAAGALGTLGITTLVELRLQKAKKFVETSYHPVSSISEAVSKVEEMARDPDIDYVDAIIFSKSEGAIITGRLTDTPKPGVKEQRFSHARDPWFYLHVQDSIRKGKGSIREAIPLAEYLFRYDRGGFWVGASAFKYFRIPFNALTRWFLDDFLHTRMLYKALHASGESRSYIVQDLALPYSTAEEFMQYTDEAFAIYPLWLCPLRQGPIPTFHPHSAEKGDDQMTLKPMLNIGLWGSGPENRDDFVRLNRHLEHVLRELGGMKWLYAHTYYPEEQFWEIYDKKWYDALRQKYSATSLPTVYEKVKVKVEADGETAGLSLWQRLWKTWPWNGFYGIQQAIASRVYVEARNSLWKKMA